MERLDRVDYFDAWYGDDTDGHRNAIAQIVGKEYCGGYTFLDEIDESKLREIMQDINRRLQSLSHVEVYPPTKSVDPIILPILVNLENGADTSNKPPGGNDGKDTVGLGHHFIYRFFLGIVRAHEQVRRLRSLTFILRLLLPKAPWDWREDEEDEFIKMVTREVCSPLYTMKSL